MKFTIRFNAERRDGKGGVESHFNYLWQDPVVRVIIVIIKNSFISRGAGGATARMALFGTLSRQSADNETQLSTSPLQPCPKVILLDVLELEEEEDSELRKRKARATLQGGTDGQVTVTYRA